MGSAPVKAGAAKPAKAGSSGVQVIDSDVWNEAKKFLNTPAKSDTPYAREMGNGGSTKPDPEGWRQVKEPSTTSSDAGGRGSRFSLQAPNRAPTISGSGVVFNKVQSARIIILAMGISGAAVIIKGSNIKAYEATLSGGHTVKVPGNMRAFAGVVIYGTISLIINELSADLGALFAVAAILMAFGDVQLFDILGGSVAGKMPNLNTPGTWITGPDGSGINTGPTGSHIVHGPNGDSIEPNPPAFHPGPNPGGKTGA